MRHSGGGHRLRLAEDHRDCSAAGSWCACESDTGTRVGGLRAQAAERAGTVLGGSQRYQASCEAAERAFASALDYEARPVRAASRCRMTGP
jgi:hypothetical protein